MGNLSKLAVLLTALTATSPVLAKGVDGAASVRSFLAECEAGGRKLWGHSLCAPIAIVDPGDGSAWTSGTAPGPLPAVRANTSFDWNGTTWLMMLAPMPTDEAERRALVFHEAFHVHQRALGLPPNSSVAPHLEQPLARESIRLEWNALARALQSEGKVRLGHVRHALAFRNERLASDPARAVVEREQMLHEGLAAYTGTALSGEAERIALQALRDGASRPGLARTFAYASGPAWGLLLDALRPGWRKGLGTSTDLPELLRLDAAAQVTPADYDGVAIHAEESAAAAARQARLDELVARTAPGHSLRLPLAQMGMDFDPNRVTPAPDGSSLYEKMTLRDKWGEVRVDGQALRIASDFSVAFVQWPLPDPTALALSPGWTLVEDGQGGWVVRPPPSN